MEHHPGGSHRTGKDADGKGYGVDNAVNKRMKTDTDHRDQSDTIASVSTTVTDEGGNKAVEQMQKNKTTE